MLITTTWTTVLTGLGLVIIGLAIHFIGGWRRGQAASAWHRATRPEWVLVLCGLVMTAYLPKVTGAPRAVITADDVVGSVLAVAFLALLAVTVARTVVRLLGMVVALFTRTTNG